MGIVANNGALRLDVLDADASCYLPAIQSMISKWQTIGATVLEVGPANMVSPTRIRPPAAQDPDSRGFPDP